MKKRVVEECDINSTDSLQVLSSIKKANFWDFRR